ncbi:MAG: hypothetical protein BWY89_01603 [Bacteroidetes bacterium ADurb.BinA012]|nr:MAG: hypothetical protein BWY89_01603 [Bacteroidetes bacterium ADurb.BinA012]
MGFASVLFSHGACKFRGCNYLGNRFLFVVGCGGKLVVESGEYLYNLLFKIIDRFAHLVGHFNHLLKSSYGCRNISLDRLGALVVNCNNLITILRVETGGEKR